MKNGTVTFGLEDDKYISSAVSGIKILPAKEPELSSNSGGITQDSITTQSEVPQAEATTLFQAAIPQCSGEGFDESLSCLVLTYPVCGGALF